jgi:hypothetical protein
MNKTQKKFSVFASGEVGLLKQLGKCTTKKCLKLVKKRNGLQKSFEKEEAIKCPQKSSKKFYNCSSKFYEGSNLQKSAQKVVKCSNTKCSGIKKKLSVLRKKMYL